ncbi:MAG: choice-of-anchor P family protein [Candidatus Eisenbacteria bacterium]
MLLVVGLTLAPSLARAQSCNYSGRAYGLFLNLPVTGVLTLADTGSLPASGGSLSSTLLAVSIPGTVTSGTLLSNTSGASCVANSDAEVQNLDLLPNHQAHLTASVVRSFSRADCASASGGSVITNLTFGGVTVLVTGAPNQVVTIPGVATLIINEQTSAGPGDITVNALHLILLDGTGDVIVASSHSDIQCAVPTRASTWGVLKATYR